VNANYGNTQGHPHSLGLARGTLINGIISDSRAGSIGVVQCVGVRKHREELAEEVIRENILGERDSSRKTFYNKCNFVLYSSISKSVETVRIPHKFHANYGNTHPHSDSCSDHH
jgi:hypothetical protein